MEPKGKMKFWIAHSGVQNIVHQHLRQHFLSQLVYVDVDRNGGCNELAFTLGTMGVDNRSWRIKVFVGLAG